MLVSVSVVALTSSSLKIKQNGGAFLCILHRLFFNIIHWFKDHLTDQCKQ